MASLKDIFGWFSVGKTPTADQFKQAWSSFWHKSEKVAMSAIFGLVDSLNALEQTKASKEDLKNATTNNKGIYSTDVLLKSAYPPASNRKGFYAFVGSKNPFRKWEVQTDGGTWIDTGQDINIADLDLADYAKNVNADGDKVVYAPDGIVPIPANVLVAGQGEYDEYIYDGYDIAIDLSNGNVIPYNDGIKRTFVNMLPVSAGHLKIVADYSGQMFKAGARLFVCDINKNVIHTLKENDVVNNTLKYDISDKGFITFYLALGDGSYDIRNSYVLEVDTDIDTGRAVKFPDGVNVDLGNIDNMVYTRKAVAKDVTDKILSYENTKNTAYISANGKLTPYNNAGAGLVMHFVDLYPEKSGSTIDIEVDKSKYSGENVAPIYVLDSAENLLLKGSLFPGKFSYKANNDVFLRFYTFYDGGTAQPNNHVDIRDSIKVQSSSGLNVVANNQVLAGDIATGYKSAYKDIPFLLVAAYINNNVGNASGTGGSFIANTDNKTLLNTERLEVDSDYVIDLGKNNQFTNSPMYGYLYESLPWDIAGNKTTGVKASVKMNVVMRRYIYFSTKGMPTVQYVGLQLAWTGFDLTKKVKLQKLPNSKVLSFGNVVSDTKNLRIDHSDSVEPVNVPWPEWVNINLIGANMKVTDKYNRIAMICEYEDSNGHYFKVPTGIARQGASTVNEAKMPLKGKMTTNFGDKFNLKWGKSFARASHHFKSFPFDSTGLRQQVFYSLVYDYLYQRRPYNQRYPNSKPFDNAVTDYRQRFNNEPMFIPYSIPCRMYMNGGFWGIYFMCHSDFCENYGIFENDKDGFIYKGNSYFDTLNLGNSWEDWEEIKTDTFMKPDPLEGGELWSDDTKQPLQDLNNWLVNANTETYKAEFEQHFDLDWQAEYFLVCYFLDAADSLHNNMVMLTYDRQKFYNMFRDGDCWSGFGPNYIIRPYNSETITPWASNSRLWNRFYSSFTNVVNAKYAELRKDGTFSLDVIDKLLSKYDQFSYEQRLADLVQWNYLHTDSNKLRSSIGQILDFMEKRIGFMDGKFGYK